MNLSTSYKYILRLSLPIMLGGAAQNLVTISDSVFLYYTSREDFATIGFIGVFYLMIVAIGYGFSRGGQILIARRAGEGDYGKVSALFYTMLVFELGLALVMFAFMWYGTPQIFYYIINSPAVYEKSMEYLSTRSWGVFFSYAGVSMIALYAGIARTRFILIDSAILAIVNIVLNYALIFGKWGLPAMGIRGAGLASTIAEIVALTLFVGYIIVDKRNFSLKFIPRRINMARVRSLFRISLPIVIQSGIGAGSWFIFFTLIEKIGDEALAVSNLGRIVYLILAVPCFGFAAGVNTLVSSFIGKAKRMAVRPIIKKTSILSFICTLLLGLPIVIIPETTLYPLLGTENMDLMNAAKPIFYIVLLIMLLYSVAIIYFNGILGTGATWFSLKLQVTAIIGYLVLLAILVMGVGVNLELAWATEILYWIVILLFSIWYLRTGKWRRLIV